MNFFEKLTGGVRMDSQEEDAHEVDNEKAEEERDEWMEEESSEGELAIDMYQTPDEIVIKAMIAAVKPDQLEVDITRDMVTVSGTREEKKSIEEEDYFFQELYWGNFSRTILLPQEIEPDEADAFEKHGLLEIHLPKIDRKKTKKLKVKAA